MVISVQVSKEKYVFLLFIKIDSPRKGLKVNNSSHNLTLIYIIPDLEKHNYFHHQGLSQKKLHEKTS